MRELAELDVSAVSGGGALIAVHGLSKGQVAGSRSQGDRGIGGSGSSRRSSTACATR